MWMNQNVINALNNFITSTATLTHPRILLSASDLVYVRHLTTWSITTEYWLAMNLNVSEGCSWWLENLYRVESTSQLRKAPKGTCFTNFTYLAMNQVTPALGNRIIVWRWDRLWYFYVAQIGSLAKRGQAILVKVNLKRFMQKHGKHTVRSNITAMVTTPGYAHWAWNRVLGMQSGTPRHTRIFDKMDIINIITNTYSCSIKAVDTRYGNIIYSTGIPLRKIPIQGNLKGGILAI